MTYLEGLPSVTKDPNPLTYTFHDLPIKDLWEDRVSPYYFQPSSGSSPKPASAGEPSSSPEPHYPKPTNPKPKPASAGTDYGDTMHEFYTRRETTAAPSNVTEPAVDDSVKEYVDQKNKEVMKHMFMLSLKSDENQSKHLDTHGDYVRAAARHATDNENRINAIAASLQRVDHRLDQVTAAMQAQQVATEEFKNLLDILGDATDEVAQDIANLDHKLAHAISIIEADFAQVDEDNLETRADIEAMKARLDALEDVATQPIKTTKISGSTIEIDAEPPELSGVVEAPQVVTPTIEVSGAVDPEALARFQKTCDAYDRHHSTNSEGRTLSEQVEEDSTTPDLIYMGAENQFDHVVIALAPRPAANSADMDIYEQDVRTLTTLLQKWGYIDDADADALHAFYAGEVTHHLETIAFRSNVDSLIEPWTDRNGHGAVVLHQHESIVDFLVSVATHLQIHNVIGHLASEVRS